MQFRLVRCLSLVAHPAFHPVVQIFFRIELGNCQEFAYRVDAHGQENEKFEERGKGGSFDQGKYSEAEKEHRYVLDIRERVIGPDHLDTSASRLNVAMSPGHLGKITEALVLARRGLEGMSKARGTEELV